MLFFVGDDVDLEAEVFELALGVGVEDDLAVLLVVFAVGVELDGDLADIAGLDRWRKRDFRAGAGDLIGRNDQRYFAVVDDLERVLQLYAFSGLREFVQGRLNEKFRRLTEAKGGIYEYRYDDEEPHLNCWKVHLCCSPGFLLPEQQHFL